LTADCSWLALAILPGPAPQVIWACGDTSAARDSGKIAVSGRRPILRQALRQKHERCSPSSYEATVDLSRSKNNSQQYLISACGIYGVTVLIRFEYCIDLILARK
jgi:hypothetical protein